MIDIKHHVEWMQKEWKSNEFWCMANKPLADEINQYFIDQGKPLYYFVTVYGQYFCKNKNQLKKLKKAFFERLVKEQETINNIIKTLKEIDEKEK